MVVVCGGVAQWIAHRTSDPRVAGSSPVSIVFFCIDLPYPVVGGVLRVVQGVCSTSCRVHPHSLARPALVGTCTNTSRMQPDNLSLACIHTLHVEHAIAIDVALTQTQRSSRVQYQPSALMHATRYH